MVHQEKLKSIAENYNCWIVEDACHSPGGYFIDSKGNKIKSGSCDYSTTAIFSFHPVKHIAAGEGGMVTTNDPYIYERLLNLRTHGIQQNKEKLLTPSKGWYYELQELGFNYRLTDFQAALGLSQLKRANEGIIKRIEIAKRYNSFFNNKEYILKHSGLVPGHAYHLYIILTKDRDRLFEFLRSKNIIVQVHYIPLHRMPYYLSRPLTSKNLNNSEFYYDHCLSLPIYPTLKKDEQLHVLELISKFYNE
jgi:dTDP-4-amino-4,6-dideoxygalactose transaminase